MLFMIDEVLHSVRPKYIVKEYNNEYRIEYLIPILPEKSFSIGYRENNGEYEIISIGGHPMDNEEYEKVEKYILTRLKRDIVEVSI